MHPRVLKQNELVETLKEERTNLSKKDATQG